MMFVNVSSVFALFLRFGRRVILSALQNYSKSVVIMPTAVGARHFKALFGAKYSTVHNVFALVDGLKVYLKQSA